MYAGVPWFEQWIWPWVAAVLCCAVLCGRCLTEERLGEVRSGRKLVAVGGDADSLAWTVRAALLC